MGMLCSMPRLSQNSFGQLPALTITICWRWLARCMANGCISFIRIYRSGRNIKGHHRPIDSELLVSELKEHERRCPRLAATDAGFYTQQNEASSGFRSRSAFAGRRPAAPLFTPLPFLPTE
jgi:hypothetical protein